MRAVLSPEGLVKVMFFWVRDLCLALAALRGGGMQDDREFKRRLGYLAIKRD